MRTLGLVAIMHKSLIVILLPLLGIVCGAQTPPTATEAFNLRIRCKQMADQKAGDLAAVDAALKWEVLETWGSSKYDATNNRCYIHIYHHIRKPGYENVVRQMYDAQVDQLLATASIRNGKKTGVIFGHAGGGPLSDDASYEAAINYMDEVMADPRKP
jgi:hypothetical protein